METFAVFLVIAIIVFVAVRLPATRAYRHPEPTASEWSRERQRRTMAHCYYCPSSAACDLRLAVKNDAVLLRELCPDAALARLVATVAWTHAD